jgi:hypothetical protein
MRSQRKRHLFLGLGLPVALVLAVALPATASAASTLTGESLNGISASGNSGTCPTTYSVSGFAFGPYAGTDTEAGTWDRNTGNFSTTFTITSGTTTITGSTLGTFVGGEVHGTISCLPSPPILQLVGVPYTATIHTPNGNFHDEGTSDVNVTIGGSAASATESFTSSLAQPVLIAPTSKDQCKNDGWKNFPQFKNQGQCVSFVESQRRT